jgi:pimeloyl-ACP methyl ester carboxylesterase
MAVSVERARQRGETIVADYDALFDRSYHWLLDRIGAPTLVIAGDVPLMPPRPLQNPPSAVTDEDFQLMANHPLVEAHRVRGGHAILDENPEEVATLINDFIRRNS